MTEYRTPQYKCAVNVLRFLRAVYGKPWEDSNENVKAIVGFLYSEKPLPYFMADMGDEMKRLYLAHPEWAI